MKVIIINGKGGAGKDLFVELCQNFYDPIYSFSTVYDIKLLARFAGWDEQKDERGRRLLSDLKEVMTNYNDFPFTKTVNKVKAATKRHNALYPNGNEPIIFIHCREPKEIQRLVDYFNAKTLLIIRKDIEDKHYGNESDDNVMDYKYDHICYNNGNKEDLKNTAEHFMFVITNETWESKLGED